MDSQSDVSLYPITSLMLIVYTRLEVIGRFVSDTKAPSDLDIEHIERGSDTTLARAVAQMPNRF